MIELNNVPIHSPEDLSALVSLSEKNLHFLIKKTPANELKKFGIPNTPSLRRQISMKALAPEQKVLSYVKAFFDYHPFDDSLCPCPEAGLAFQYGDILAIVNQDDPNWWQVCVFFFSFSFLPRFICYLYSLIIQMGEDTYFG